jgi:aspartate kinase
MKVFKFGGASIKSSQAIKNMAKMVGESDDDSLIIIVSAMGKTTNHLEHILHDSRAGIDYENSFQALLQYHHQICKELFETDEVSNEISELFDLLRQQIKNCNEEPYDFAYDQCVSFGERVSSTIVSRFLQKPGSDCQLWDATELITTDNTYREAIVNWEKTTSQIREKVKNVPSGSWYVTQGFIAGHNGQTTTLGREGSDYTAAIFAVAVNANSLTVWKDVPGIMSADPKILPNAVKFDELSYREASEMTYYGAKVIHPDTIQPLAENNIALHVRDFTNPHQQGTIIHDCTTVQVVPCIIFKENQLLVSFQFSDYNFINEQHLVTIYDVLDQLHIHVNMMQNSATSFSICIDDHPAKIDAIVEQLKGYFYIHYNRSLALLTIKNYDAPTLEAVVPKTGILLEQKSRSDVQIVYQHNS